MSKIVKVRVSSEDLMRDLEKFRQRAIEIGATDAKIIKETNPVQAKNYEIVGRLEAEAFYEGYHLALAFAGGPCKQLWCLE